jgi:Flp pilus assembly protein TadG
MGKRRTGSQAQSLVEFAIALPLLVFLLLGICQYGFIFAAHIGLRNATAVGARYATLQLNPSPSITQIQNVTKGAAGQIPMVASNSVIVTVDTNVTVGGVSGAKSVQAQCNLKLMVPFVVPGAVSGGSLALSATTIMR